MTSPINQVWLFLSAITVVSWALASPRGGEEFLPSALVTAGALALAAIKGRLIVRHFMEVRTAPAWLRRFTDIWLVILTTTIFAIYLY